MGKCVKCRKETNNRYIYYTGESTSINVNDKGYRTEYYTKYENIENHGEFLCGRCTRIKISIILGIFAFLGIGILYGIIHDLLSGKEIETIWGTIVFAICSLGVLFIFIYTLSLVILDKPFNASKGSLKLIEVLSKKETSGKIYFDIDRYKRLQ